MVDGLMIYPKRSGCWQEYKELAANACYSIIFIGVALVLLRPVMVRQILSRAEAYSSVGLVEESKRECEKALLIDSEGSLAWRQLARFYRATGDREMAYGAYQKATQADAKNKPAQFELGMMYVEDGLYQSAIPCFEQVRELGPEKIKDSPPGTPSYHRDSLDMLALCYEKAGNPTKMEFTLEEIRIFYPGFGNADARLAQLKEGSHTAGRAGVVPSPRP
jgi:tetratricopeptide (TPR) repeat protein